MREIKVRGYAVEEMVGSQWLCGTGVFKMEFTDEYAERTGVKEEHFIFTDSGWVEVRGESIGQYTGLKDKNDQEIYEKDFIKMADSLYRVEWSGRYCGYRLFDNAASTGLNNYHGMDYEVVGNQFDNPELLEVAE